VSEEAAFLAALKANPADDTARLVYADWLDEHGEHAKAEYLRLVAALALREDNLQATGEAESLLGVAERLPEEWRSAAGSRFNLVLDGWTDKIRAIKWLREATGDGLGRRRPPARTCRTPSSTAPDLNWPGLGTRAQSARRAGTRESSPPPKARSNPMGCTTLSSATRFSCGTHDAGRPPRPAVGRSERCEKR
jgi:uncharacterized protein (TIGR02996 family)